MPSFVITWKPERWPYDEIIKLVRAHTSGMPAKSSWRFRAHRRGALGDRVFLLKQGTPRGIFGTGTIIELPDQTAETEGEKLL